MDDVQILVGDCKEVLRELPAESFRCCITSPPYFGLRSYLPDAVKMRDDLTPEEREHVEKELTRLNIHPASGVV